MGKFSLATIGTVTLFGLGIAAGTIANASPNIIFHKLESRAGKLESRAGETPTPQEFLQRSNVAGAGETPTLQEFLQRSNVAGVQVAQQPNCNNPQTQSEMNVCAGIAYRNADRRLNQVYQQLLPKLPASRRQQLVTAQQAWIRYRDASCNFERSEVEGGSMAPMVQASCLARLTEQRTKDLQQYLESTNR